jgi:hypothetical protein
MCISLGVLSISGTASATLIESIAALEEGAMYRVLFVTSTSTQALSSDIEFYNTFVSTAADSGSVTGSLGLTWKALASTATDNAQDNTGVLKSDSSMVTMFNTRGEIVAYSGYDLWDGELNIHNQYDENRVEFYNIAVFTGTLSDGSSDLPLGVNYVVQTGYAYFMDDGWAENGPLEATLELSIYAVSSVVVKPLTDVPEPRTVILLSLGLAGLSFSRYRRQS